MNRSSTSCRECRRALSVGDVRPADLKHFQAHLVNCPECRSYLEDVTNLSEEIIAWRSSLSGIEPTAAARTRWMTEVKKSQPSPQADPASVLTYWWSEIFWPHRQAWAGMAAVWVLMWAINWERPAQPKTSFVAKASPAAEALQTFSENRRLLAELIPIEMHSAPPPPSQPRSELRTSWKAS